MRTHLALALRAMLLAGAACLIVAALVGCQSDGDGGVTDTTQYINTGGTYVSDGRPMNDPVVSMVRDSGTRTSICLGVDVSPVLDLFSVAFTLRYDPTVLRYTGFQPGDFLGSASETIVEVSAQPSTAPNSVVVGVTRNAAAIDPDVGVTGRGRIITLCFDLVGPGNSLMVFTGNLAGYNSGGTAPGNVVLDASDFIGGTVTVQ